MTWIEERFNRLAKESDCFTSLVHYWNSVQTEDFTIPDSKALRYLSAQLDLAARNAFEEFATILRASPEHELRIYELNRQPRKVGKSSLSKSILRNASSFEQMVALGDWLGRKMINKPHTFVFSNKDRDYVPVKTTSSSLMHVVLGSTKGIDKAPRYNDWAANDPWSNPNQTRFIYPLESLEIARQPNFVAATLLKGTAYESEYIDENWRYGNRFACVESHGQSKNSPQKLTSAGLNLAAMAERFGADPHVNLIDQFSFENHLDDGYRDYEDPNLSLRSLLTAARDAFRSTETINSLMKVLLASKIGPVTTPLLRRRIVAVLW